MLVSSDKSGGDAAMANGGSCVDDPNMTSKKSDGACVQSSVQGDPPKKTSVEHRKHDHWNSRAMFQWEGELPKVSYMDPPPDLLPILSGPLQMELLTWTGIVMFLDGLLYCLTFLPIKLLAVVWDLVHATVRQTKSPLYPKQLYVLVQAIVIVVATFFIDELSMMEAYRFVVQLSWTRTWVLYSLFDVFDDLMTRFGQRVMGSLLYSIKEQRSYVPIMTCLGICYVAAHGFVMNLKISTIHIAIDRGNMLFALLLAVKLPELKGGTYPSVTRKNLFRTCLNDMVDRAKCVVFSVLIFLDKSSRFPLEQWMDWMPALCEASFMIFGSEVLVDWLKHAGFVMFSADEITGDVYASFRRAICEDLIRNTEDDVTGMGDCTVSVLSDNFGFVQLPLTCVILNVLWRMEVDSLKSGSWLPVLVLCIGFLGLFVCKLITHHLLLEYGRSYYSQMVERLSSSTNLSTSVGGTQTTAVRTEEETTEFSNVATGEGHHVDFVQSIPDVQHPDSVLGPLPAFENIPPEIPEAASTYSFHSFDSGSSGANHSLHERTASDSAVYRPSQSDDLHRERPVMNDTPHLRMRKTSSTGNIASPEDLLTRTRSQPVRALKSMSMPSKFKSKSKGPCVVHGKEGCFQCKYYKAKHSPLSLSSIVLDALNEINDSSDNISDKFKDE